MVSGGLSGFRKHQSVSSEVATARDVGAKQAAVVTKEEATWLAGRIGKDGAFDNGERRLVERMRELEKELPAGLKALLDRAA